MVAVGDSAEVELIFTSNKGHAPFEKNATVTCNDNDRGNFQLKLKGRTYEFPDSLKPLSLSVGSIKWEIKDRDKEMKLKVKNESKNPVKMHLVSQPYGYLKIELPDSEIKPGKDKEIKVKILSTVKDEEFKKSFTFELNDSTGTRYTIPTILARPVIMPPIQAAPAKKPVNAPLDTTAKIR